MIGTACLGLEFTVQMSSSGRITFRNVGFFLAPEKGLSVPCQTYPNTFGCRRHSLAVLAVTTSAALAQG